MAKRSANRSVPSTSKACIEGLEARQLLAFSAFVNFQPAHSTKATGYAADIGEVFGARGGGLSYGWNAVNNNAIDRNSTRSPDQRYDTFAQLQVGGNFTWELAVPVGTYNVKLTAGDPLSNNAFYHLFAENRQMINGAPSDAQRWIGSNFVVVVNDGRLTITNGPNASNNKINFIEVTKAAPTTPSNLSANTPLAMQVTMSWQDNSNNEDGFAIERSIGQSNTWQTVGTVGANVTTFTDTNLTPSTEYRYRVRSFNDVATYTFYTNIQTVTTAMVPGAAPIAPSNLVGALNVSFVTLTWSDNSSNEDKFIIQKIGYSGGWETEREVPANTTTTSVWVRSASNSQFRVVARNSTGGNSLASNDITIFTKPDAPYSVGAQAVSSSAIDIFWDSADSCEFHVDRLVNGTWVRIASNVLSLNYPDTNLPAATQQSYRVLAVAANVAGDSDPSEAATATTFPGGIVPSVPVGVATTRAVLPPRDTLFSTKLLDESADDDVNET